MVCRIAPFSMTLNDPKPRFQGQAILEMWKVYFEKLYSAKAVSKYRSIFLNKLSIFPDRLCDALFTVQDIVSAMHKHKQKLNKAAGRDGLQA